MEELVLEKKRRKTVQKFSCIHNKIQNNRFVFFFPEKKGQTFIDHFIINKLDLVDHVDCSRLKKKKQKKNNNINNKFHPRVCI
jgi:hypothetical protein